jgi:hypothetical protein
MSHWRGLKPKWFILSNIFALGMFLVPVSQVFATCTLSDLAPCKPYFKVFGSDVFAGGSFIDQNGFCDTSSANYQDYSSVKPKIGGIMAFSNRAVGGGSNGGSSSQYGVLSLGNVDASVAGGGFYSSGVSSAGGNSVEALTFANYTSINSPWGGQFQGTIRQSHCIPDYYSKKPTAAGSVTDLNPNTLSGSTASGTYAAHSLASVYSLNTSAIPLSANQKITIFSDVPVYIGGNITYPSSITASQVPKLALIVKGASIYIGPGVTNLDGLYIAQAGNNDQLTSDTGEIWTCHDNTTNPITATYIFSTCRVTSPAQKCLQVKNGAFIAKQINLTRIAASDIANPTAGEDALGTAQTACVNNNIAEVFNFSPLMLIGGGFFTPNNNPPFNVESVVSLPPTL